MTPPGTAGRPADWPPHIRDRYGITERPRWLPWVLGALLVTALLAVTVVGWRLANPAIRAGIDSYDTVSDDHISLTFVVQRRERSAATCVLRARALDGYDVGYTTVELAPAAGRSVHTYQMRTAYRAVVAELLGCGVEGPPPGVPGAQFRPGVVPPEQPWSP